MSSPARSDRDEGPRVGAARRQARPGAPVSPRPRLRRGVLHSGAASSRIVIPILCLVLDLTVVLLTITVASALRQRLTFLSAATDIDQAVAQMGALMVLVWLGFLAFFGTYQPHQLSVGTEEYKNVVNASVITAGVVGIGCYLTKFPLSRGFFVLSFLVGIPLLVLGRFLLRRLLHVAQSRGLFRHRVLVAGDNAHIDEISAILEREAWLGYHVVGALRAEGASDSEETPRGVRYVGDATAAADAAIRMRADSLVVAGGAFSSSVELRRAQWDLADSHVQVIVAPSVTDVARERVKVRPIAGLPLVFVEQPKSAQALRRAKRLFDLAGAGTLVVVLSPLLLIGALAVKLADGGPMLFHQLRVGRDGQQFAMLKFRSMVVGAEAMLPSLAGENEGEGLLFKMADDPRITRAGRWMRRYSVDELPQLFNVLRGEMSLVGPRPALPAEVMRYDTDVSRRLRVRPGITGLWQVSGRSDLPWEDTVRLDLYYVDNWSMLQDISILVRTLAAVLRGSGAY